MTKYRLGRRYAPDERDRDYAIKPCHLCETPVSRYWHSPGALDQGDTPECIGYAGYQYLVAGPVCNRPPFSPTQLYKIAQRNDEWEGDNYEGTSVRGLFKSLRSLGYVFGYRWAWDVDVMMAHVLTVGPVVVGSSWYEAMLYPSQDGVIEPFGEELGGHAYIVVGGNRRTRMCRIVNSWGMEWGQCGRAWISFEHMQKLLDNFGEACAAFEMQE